MWKRHATGKKSVELSFSDKRIASSNNRLRQSEIRRSFCFVVSMLRLLRCVHTQTEGGLFYPYIIQSVGFGEPVCL